MAKREEFYGIPVVSPGLDQFEHDVLRGAIHNLQALNFEVVQIGIKDGRPAFLVQEFDLTKIDVEPRDETKIKFGRIVGDVNQPVEDGD